MMECVVELFSAPLYIDRMTVHTCVHTYLQYDSPRPILRISSVKARRERDACEPWRRMASVDYVHIAFASPVCVSSVFFERLDCLAISSPSSWLESNAANQFRLRSS